ncbi:hypothetical protein HELRODRAFT_174686 [Helobdella robusta]|uniref:C2H2-type domain-containing protein n=1 Tax=Helobdella robusta TaxID=6412 RepID=T1F8D4_HELRO|nr:hypothetical protein HELRODRAFT_174686 [Helobdella robusta]ESO01713.1 hypothetical protein HELRODRAFT_174686 [Helobdella robusta]
MSILKPKSSEILQQELNKTSIKSNNSNDFSEKQNSDAHQLKTSHISKNLEHLSLTSTKNTKESNKKKTPEEFLEMQTKHICSEMSHPWCTDHSYALKHKVVEGSTLLYNSIIPSDGSYNRFEFAVPTTEESAHVHLKTTHPCCTDHSYDIRHRRPNEKNVEKVPLHELPEDLSCLPNDVHEICLNDDLDLPYIKTSKTIPCSSSSEILPIKNKTSSKRLKKFYPTALENIMENEIEVLKNQTTAFSETQIKFFKSSIWQHDFICQRLAAHYLKELPKRRMYQGMNLTCCKPNVCLTCDAAFTRLHSLKYHMLVHYGLNRFTCGDCGHLFRHAGHYKKHLRGHLEKKLHHGGECPAKFKGRNTHKQHIKVRRCKTTVSGDSFTTNENVLAKSNEHEDTISANNSSPINIKESFYGTIINGRLVSSTFMPSSAAGKNFLSISNKVNVITPEIDYQSPATLVPLPSTAEKSDFEIMKEDCVKQEPVDTGYTDYWPGILPAPTIINPLSKEHTETYIKVKVKDENLVAPSLFSTSSTSSSKSSAVSTSADFMRNLPTESANSPGKAPIIFFSDFPAIKPRLIIIEPDH